MAAMPEQPAPDAQTSFLTRLIDDAGLFPPALLPMDAAVEQHNRVLTGPHRWLVARFICPAPRLAELGEALPDEPDSDWEVSALLEVAEGPWPEALAGQVEAIARFSDETGVPVRVIEGRLPAEWSVDGAEPGAIVDLTDMIQASGLDADPPVRVFLEVPVAGAGDDVTRTALEAIAEAREDHGATRVALPGAKVRCGGKTADAFPTPEEVALVVAACREQGIPFKATAGLHHPFRHLDTATGFTQHGFLNVVGAAILGRARGLDEETLATLLADDAPGHFELSPDRFRWQGVSVRADEIEDARRDLFVAYGSCSIDEPVEDLVALGVLLSGDPG
jgi:hypothetical protein